MPSPGWYADPQDPSGLRWFDGENWTEFQHSGVEASPAGNDQYAQQTTVFAEQPGSYGGHDPAAETARFMPATAQPPNLQPPNQQPPSLQPPTWAATSQPPWAAPPAYTQALPQPTRSTRKPLLIVIAAVVVVALVLLGSWLLFFRGSSTKFTYQGKPIANSAGVLSQAESNLKQIVTTRHGAENSDTRCYFAQPTNPPSGQKKTNIDSALRCGPVLFVDGDASKTYLSFALNGTAAGSSENLVASPTPQSSEPAAIPDGLALKRPDGKVAPSGSDGLSVPNPPPADANVITTNTVPAGSPVTTAVVGSLNGGIKITDLGKVSRYGQGDTARTAPPGQQLYAFTLGAAAGNSGDVVDLSSATTLSVNGGAGRALPKPAAGQDIVVAVPSSATTADLVLQDGALKQTFSLLTGKPGAANLAVLARVHRSDTINQTVAVTFNYSTRVVFSDGVTAQSQTATISVTSASLAYRDDVNGVSASSPANALLMPDITYTSSHDGGPFGVDTSLLTFTPTGGTPIPAKNISTDPTKIRNVFDVPASVTTGTITISGSATETFSSGGGTYTVAVATPMTIPIDFAAG